MPILRRTKKSALPARLQQLLAGGENDRLDFKKEISDPARIARTMVSFANRHGGVILVGVDDDKTLCGVHPDEEQHMLSQAASLYCRPAIELQINEHPLKKKSILEVVVPEGADKPYYAKGEDNKWWAYIRVEDRSQLASKVMLEVIKRKARDRETLIEYTNREQKLLEFLSTHETITLKQYCKLADVSRRLAQHVLINLASIGILHIHQAGQEERYSLVQKS